ncbi:hypothetical protein ABEB36_000418 [Hypothenemus hampei]|uniref:THAP-type domain-containing protein n=1 Tax=Hypothenemus hampei TaxID=57062 RepID=A0ABD1FB44_HYPHA
MSKKGGTVCVVRGCLNRTTKKDITLLRFPKDAERANRWILACNREDLIDKTPIQLYNNYRICALHFEDTMFTNPLRNRLLPSANPTIFPQAIKRLRNVEGNIKAIAPQSSSMQDSSIPSTSKMLDMPAMINTPLHIDIDESTGLPPMTSPMSTQTAMTLTSNSPRKEKLRKKVKELRRQSIAYKRAVTSTKKKSTLEDLDKLCEQFLPESLADLVKMQARLTNAKPKERRYSMKYKEFALSLYFLGPRAYKFLKKLLCLPSKRLLERMTQKII